VRVELGGRLVLLEEISDHGTAWSPGVEHADGADLRPNWQPTQLGRLMEMLRGPVRQDARLSVTNHSG
jgi:hypothetical protein